MGAKLIHGDSLSVMKGIESESVDMVFADPPFNVGKEYGGKQQSDKRDDYYDWVHGWVSECFRLLKPTGVFFHMTIDRHLPYILPIMSELGHLVNIIKWKNVSAQPSSRSFQNWTQPILMYAKDRGSYKFNEHAQVRASTVMSWSKKRTSRPGKMSDYWDDITPVYSGSVVHKEAILEPGTRMKIHLAQMPTALATRCILFATEPGDTVLDPFSGSGTVGVSALQLDRQFIGIEREGKYIELQKSRFASVTSQMDIFDIVGGRATSKSFDVVYEGDAL